MADVAAAPPSAGGTGLPRQAPPSAATPAAAPSAPAGAGL